ncbi:hypothetical protein MRX96_000974 [Rhipicephalus microplus]
MCSPAEFEYIDTGSEYGFFAQDIVNSVFRICEETVYMKVCLEYVIPDGPDYSCRIVHFYGLARVGHLFGLGIVGHLAGLARVFRLGAFLELSTARRCSGALRALEMLSSLSPRVVVIATLSSSWSDS